MSGFRSDLVTKALRTKAGKPLCARDGRRLYTLVEPLVYQRPCDKFNLEIIVPIGFITDFGSVPRLPVVYTLLGDIAQEPFVLHDYMYTIKRFSRKFSDEVLHEALTFVEVPDYKCDAIYAGVRLGGASHYVER